MLFSFFMPPAKAQERMELTYVIFTFVWWIFMLKKGTLTEKNIALKIIVITAY